MAASTPDSGSNGDADGVRRGVVVMHDVREEIERLQDTVLVAVSDAGFDDASTFAVRLALEEAVANAFRHGNREDPEKTVTVRYAVSEHQIELAVEDEGPGFDPGAVPDPTEDANLEIPSGRGIMLMRAYMTSVEIVAPGNRIEMTFRRD
jgi:serine/threonine-protein kinase RsbW